jgi:hypothetical protein
MSFRSFEGVRKEELKNFPQPLFDFERDFIGASEQMVGPIGSFTFKNKEKVLEHAEETGKVGSNFQDCGPFSDTQQRAIRREVAALRGVSDIFGDIFSAPLEDLKGEKLSFRLYGERAMNEAVLVEASRQVYLEKGGRNEDFNKRMIQESQEALYPRIDRELALESLGLLAGRAERILESGKPISGFVNGVLDRYPFVSEAHGREPEVLKPEVMKQVYGMLKQQYGQLFEILRSEFSEVGNDNIVEVTERWFEIIGFKDKGWTVRDARDSRKGFVIVPQDLAIDVGKRSKKAKWQAIEGLIIHESSHIAASMNAFEVGQKGLALGWIGYEPTNEGLAMLKEKSWSGEASNNDVITRDHYRYILAAFATGVLDGRKHGIQDCYDFGVNLSTLSRISTQIKKDKSTDLDETEHAARSQVGEHIYRLFRGMPDGIAMIKDIVYLDGYTKEVKAFNDTDDVEGRMARSMRGKFNDFDSVQVATVDELYGAQN